MEYTNSFTKVTIGCRKCGRWFEQRPVDHYKAVGCPFCGESAGEKAIAVALDRLKEPYEIQKTFPGLIFKSSLKFDFWIPRLKMCIEYNGIQHYEPVEHFGGMEKFLTNLKRDEAKERYCARVGIKILIIPYTTPMEDIEFIIAGAFNDRIL